MNSHLPQAVVRLLDANLNRCSEGLRTLEDIARFVLNDLALCAQYKELRHQLVVVIHRLSGPERLLSRDVAGDVGTTVTTETESIRQDLRSVAMAASSRVEQSLRALEECTKLSSSAEASQLEAQRYRVYQLNAKLILKLHRDREFLQRANLYVLADCKLGLTEFVDRIAALSAAGVDLIQLRDKSADAATQIEYAEAALQVITESKTRLIINDRSDIAVVCKAHGVHVGQNDLPVTEARRFLPIHALVGLSTHDAEQCETAMQLDVDYIGIGPTFTSTTKRFDRFAGLDYLRYVASRVGDLPAFAIGGIDHANLGQVLATGIRRVAVAGAIWNAPSPIDAAKRFKDMLAS